MDEELKKRMIIQGDIHIYSIGKTSGRLSQKIEVFWSKHRNVFLHV
jgi:hypothetical protein